MGVSVREEPHMSATPANKAHSTNPNGPSYVPGAVENMVLRPDRPAWDIRGTTVAGDRTPVTAPRGRRWSMGTEAFVLTNSAESCSCRTPSVSQGFVINTPMSPPSCPRCDSPMVRRTARRGQHQGSEFWGCPNFPKCRGIVSDPPPDHPESDVGERPAPILPEDEPSDNGGDSRGWQARVLTAVEEVVETVDKVQRWQLESDEPDATGKWEDKEHRKKVLRYVWKRDGRRCGLCAGEMKLEGAHIEHIVPKVFAVFDIRKGGKAVEGTRYKSRLHKLDNLQAAHTYCNRRKGNTPEVSKWRHPNMPAITVADTDDGKEFVVPWKPTRKRAHPRTRRP